MKDLIEFAAELGVTIHLAHLAPGYLGGYDPATRQVWLDARLTPAERRSVCAHEFAHHYYGDECSDDGGPIERRADAYAATLLIDPVEYARLALIDRDPYVLAEEFGVTVDVIHDFRRYCLRAFGRATYFKPSADRARRIA